MNRLLDRLFRGTIRTGTLIVTWSDGVVSRYGGGEAPTAYLRFARRSAELAVLRNPELGIGEAYMAGHIGFEPATAYEFLMLVNDNWDQVRNTGWTRLLARLRYLKRRIAQNNSWQRARRNVAHHYDLDERLYRLFLDSDMQYSCAYFDRRGAGLDEAQWAKKRHIAAKLVLRPGIEVLDIGSGWGGLGLFLGESAAAQVTGVTLSGEQHRVSNERARALGLAERVRFELADYRDLRRSFDRIVSVGMFEHVGIGHYREYFENCARLLRPDGVMLLHSIGRSDGPGATNPWIAKYIFPGGYIPALSEVLPAIERAGLIVSDVEILRLHYAETLRAWRERFVARWQEAAAIYDERFCRMWEFYLAGSEATFRSGHMNVFQIQLVRDQTAVPLTRDYIVDAEAAMNARRGADESLRIAGE